MKKKSAFAASNEQSKDEVQNPTDLKLRKLPLRFQMDTVFELMKDVNCKVFCNVCMPNIVRQVVSICLIITSKRICNTVVTIPNLKLWGIKRDFLELLINIDDITLKSNHKHCSVDEMKKVLSSLFSLFDEYVILLISFHGTRKYIKQKPDPTDTKTDKSDSSSSNLDLRDQEASRIIFHEKYFPEKPYQESYQNNAELEKEKEKEIVQEKKKIKINPKPRSRKTGLKSK